MSEARDLFELAVKPRFEKAQPHWLKLARVTAHYLAKRDGKTNINEVRKECPPPPGVDSRILGAVFNRKDFVRVGFVNSDRKTCHGRIIAEFALRDAS